MADQNALEPYLLDPAVSIRHTIETIDKSQLRIALFVDTERRLLGIATDGDIRRAVLRGVSLDAPSSEIMTTAPQVAEEGTPDDAILTRMQSLSLYQLPVLDAEGRLVGLRTIDGLLRRTTHPNRVVLMAGGFGTRLRPLTDSRPKPMIDVGGRPLLETVLTSFIARGFVRFSISVNYRADMIEEYFGDGSAWGAEIQYLRETEPLGTAGSLTLLRDRPEEPFFVMNADILTSVNFRHLMDFHIEADAVATMAVRNHDMTIPYGVVDVDRHRLTAIREKPVHSFFINAGLYVLAPSALDRLQAGVRIDMPALFEGLIAEGKTVSAFPIREYWRDIGQHADLARAEDDFDTVFGG